MLIVESGVGDPLADSYISLSDARTFAANYGITLPTNDAEAEIALRQGCQYIELQEGRYSGSRVSTSQALGWPRSDASNSVGVDYPDNVVPIQLGRAQVAAAAEFAKGTDVRATDDGKSVASESVTGAVAVSYFNNGKTGEGVVITRALDELRILLVNGGGYSFRVERG